MKQWLQNLRFISSQLITATSDITPPDNARVVYVACTDSNGAVSTGAWWALDKAVGSNIYGKIPDQGIWLPVCILDGSQATLSIMMSNTFYVRIFWFA